MAFFAVLLAAMGGSALGVGISNDAAAVAALGAFAIFVAGTIGSEI